MDDPHTHAHDHGPHARIGGGQECVLCPICVLLQALSTSRPEVMEHLAAAGRELGLALQAIVDGHAGAGQEGATDEGGGRGRARGGEQRRDDGAERGEGLERIEVE